MFPVFFSSLLPCFLSFLFSPSPSSGLRGAVAVALALNIRTEHRSVIVTTTLFVVLFTTLFLGLLTAPVLRLLGLQQPEEVRYAIFFVFFCFFIISFYFFGFSVFYYFSTFFGLVIFFILSFLVRMFCIFFAIVMVSF